MDVEVAALSVVIITSFLTAVLLYKKEKMFLLTGILSSALYIIYFVAYGFMIVFYATLVLAFVPDTAQIFADEWVRWHMCRWPLCYFSIILDEVGFYIMLFFTSLSQLIVLSLNLIKKLEIK